MTAADRNRLCELAEGVINGEIGSDEFIELGNWLDGSEMARQLYLECMTLDSMLGDLLDDCSGADESDTAEEREEVVVRGYFGFGRRGGLAVAAVAVASAVLLIGFGLLNWKDGKLAGRANPEEELEGIPSVVRGERLEVEAGNVRKVLLPSGVEAELTGPALLSVSGDSSAELMHGTASFAVPEGAEGFSVAVPWGKVIDLGTAFELEIGQSLETAVRVLRGRVRVISSVDGSSTEIGADEEIWLISSGLGFGAVVAESTGGSTNSVNGYRDDPGSSANSIPVAHWKFSGEEGTWLIENGGVRLVAGPRPPRHAGFFEANTAAHFDGGSALRRSDRGAGSAFDFGNGEEITLEAWVNPSGMEDDRNVYIVGKGRTSNVAMAAENQNYSLRLRGRGAEACVSFLFRSMAAGDGSTEGDYHRWTALRGMLPGTGWHHVAVSYRFGDPDSVTSWLDGKPQNGEWDMGGATRHPPVVDDDEVWVGSARGGEPANSFSGALDEVAIYRGMFDADDIARRVNPSFGQR